MSLPLFINGIGTALPHRTASNDAFAILTGVDSTWIRERTGVSTRHVARSTEEIRALAVSAGVSALADAHFAPNEVSLVVSACGCCRRDGPLVSAAALVEELGLERARKLELTTPRTAFLDGLLVAASFEEPGAVLIVGTDGYLAATDIRDRRRCCNYSDGAGAVVLSRREGIARIEKLSSGRLEDTLAANLGVESELLWTGSAERKVQAMACQALEAGLRAGRSEEAIRIVTQEIRSLDGLCPTSAASLYNPLASSGYMPAASLPNLLARLLREPGSASGNRVMLFVSDGSASWTSCLATIERIPERDESTELLPHGAVEKMETVLGPDDLGARIALAAERSCRGGQPLVAVALRLAIEGGPRDWPSHIVREISSTLRSHTRADDLVLQLHGALAFALLLRGITRKDADRLAQRLAVLLEGIDPAGELQMQTTTSCLPFVETERPELFAKEVLRRLA